MKTKHLVNIMRADRPNDCRDFWDILKSTPIKTMPKKSHTTRNRLLAVASALTITGCSLIVILNFNTIKSFISVSPELPEVPIIITADEKDEFSSSDSSQELSDPSVRIAPLLKWAMETAPENALFRTMVSDPSFYEYLNNYEYDGYKYDDFKNGTLKDQFDSDAYYAKMNELEYNARMDFFKYITEKYGIENAEKSVDSSDYSMEEYHFIANLSRDQINRLAEAGCILRLALPKGDVGNKDVITDGLHSQIEGTPGEPDYVVDKNDIEAKPQEKNEVLVVLRIDTGDYQEFNAKHYRDKIKVLTYDQLNEAYVKSYVDSFVTDHKLTPSKYIVGIVLDPYQKIVDKKVTLDHYGCNASFIVSLTKEQINNLADDERVLVIAPYGIIEEPDFDAKDDGTILS